MTAASGLWTASNRARRASTRRSAASQLFFTDVEPWVAEIITKVRPFTMTSNGYPRSATQCRMPHDELLP